MLSAEWKAGEPLLYRDEMFRLEQTDREVLMNTRERIVEPGGAILFVEDPGLGIVGTCALQKTGEGSFELTKMGVQPAHV